ncbi:MAG TPA: hypothetical protein DCZ55_17945 [Cyanobacteria bacterium UBA11371]|nr:hypothetical protein [Cyanobacteria bacterium UBA11371]
MENLPVSPIETLNAAIQSYNPFKNAGIVKEQNIWGKGFPDLASLNKKASDTVFKAIEQVKTSQLSHEKVTSLVLTAQQGVGKTHILSRIRHRIEREGGGLFVYGNVDKYTDLNLIKYQFQQTLADSLRYIGSQGVMQWQEVAAVMANQGFKASNPNAQPLTPEQLVRKFDEVYSRRLAKNRNLMDELTRQVRRAKTNAEPYIVRAILWTLSETQAPFAIRWLSGDELDQSTAEYMGLPSNANKTNQDREAEALNTVLQILNLVSHYNPVIICFDQLESLKVNNGGFTTAQVVAELVSSLYNTLSQSELGQGIVILTVMLPDTWANTVNLMVGGVPDRVSKYTERKPIQLTPLNGKSMVDLVSLWLQEELYKPNQLIPPHPVYPFEESQIKELGKGKLTVREFLEWCAENFKVHIPPLPEDPEERFELALQRELEAETGDALDNNQLIADSLCFGFGLLKGQILEGETLTGEKLNKVAIKELVEVTPKNLNNGWINFKIIGTENGKQIKIGVAVIQSKLYQLTVGLRRLNNYETFDLTRGCLVRSKSKTEKINKNSEAAKLLQQLKTEKGGEHVDIIEDQIRPLLAIWSVYQKRENYNLSEEDILHFISQKQIVFANNLLREILSDPSGKSNEDSVEDDPELWKEFESSSSDEIADADDGNLYDEFN